MSQKNARTAHPSLELLEDRQLMDSAAPASLSVIQQQMQDVLQQSLIAEPGDALAAIQKVNDATDALVSETAGALAGARQTLTTDQNTLITLGVASSDAKAALDAKLPRVAVADLPFAGTTNGWGPAERDMSNGETRSGDGRTIAIRGVTYPRGLGVHAPSTTTFALNGQYTRFESVVGIDDETGGRGSVIFQVWGDGRKLFDSGVMTGTMPGKAISVDLAGVKQLQLIVTDGGNGNICDHADWAAARFMLPDSGAATTIPASDLHFASAQNGWGPVERNMSNGEFSAKDGRMITIRGITYARGLGVHAPSTVALALKGQYTRFESMVGIDDETRGGGSVIFQVWGDGRKLFDSGLMQGTTPAKAVSVDITGVQNLQLTVTNGGNGNISDHADWANATLTYTDNGVTAQRSAIALLAAQTTATQTAIANDTIVIGTLTGTLAEQQADAAAFDALIGGLPSRIAASPPLSTRHLTLEQWAMALGEGNAVAEQLLSSGQAIDLVLASAQTQGRAHHENAARWDAFDAGLAQVLSDLGDRSVLAGLPGLVTPQLQHAEIMDATWNQVQSVLTQANAAAVATERPGRIAAVRASTILSRPSVEVIKNGDWLDLRTSGFDGKQSFMFGSAQITPQAGDRIITIPGFYAPENLRDNIPELQTMLNHQTNALPWTEVPAPATAAADIFSQSTLGTWTAEIVTADGTATPLALMQATSNALGTTGFTGLTPDGETGRELMAPVPMMTITRPDGRTIRMAFSGMPAGYTLYVERTFLAASRQPYKTAAITAGAFSLDLSAELQPWQLGFAWTMTDPSGAIVRDGTFSVDQQMDPLMLTHIKTTPFPVGTRDLPLSLIHNTTSSPLAITTQQPEGTRPLTEDSILVHPMNGKDIRLIFTPTGECRVMPHGTITDLDTRSGNGVTVTLTRVRADGSRDEPWTRTLENGQTLDFGSLREPFFGMDTGFSLELTISSDGNDLCDSIGVDVQFAVEYPRCATATALPMGVIAPALEGRIGSDMIVLTDVFNRGPGVLTYNSSSDDIARWIVGPSYDTMDPNIKSDYRTVVDRAKAAMWQPYMEAMKTAFMDVLMERNGVVRPRKSGGFTDPTGHSYHTAIPNPPTWGDFYAVADQQFDKCYGVYGRICSDSGTLMDNERLRLLRTEQLENGLHNALRDAGLLSAQSAPPSSRSLSEQRRLDDIFTQYTGGPDRAGWTVADHENLGRMIAAWERATAGLVTDSGGQWDWMQPDMDGSTDAGPPVATPEATIRAAAWNRLQSLFRVADAVPGTDNDRRIMTDSVLGYLTAGLLQEAGRNRSDANLTALAHDLSVVTGIPERSFLIALQKTNADDRARDVLLTLWNRGFFGVRLAEQVASPATRGLPMDVRQYPGDGDHERSVVVTFNFLMGTGPASAYHHANIYLADATGNMLSKMPLTASIDHQLSATIPFSTLSSRLPSGTHAVKFIVQVLPEDGSRFFVMMSNEERVEVAEGGPLSDLSTLPESDPNHDEEKIILSLLQNSETLFFEDLSSWKWSLASTAHDGHALNAIDFIRAGADGASVHTPADGKVVLNRKDTGGNTTVVVEHTYISGDRTIYWYTKYLHMHCNDQDMVTVTKADGSVSILGVGTQLKASDIVGNTGSEGQSTGPHLHEETLIGPDGRKLSESEFFTTKAVDMRLLLTTGERQVSVLATAGYMVGENFQDSGRGRVSVRWDDTLSAWVDDINHTVYDRREQQNLLAGSSTYWLAWEAGRTIEQMARVVWVTVKNVKKPDGSVADVSMWVRSTESQAPTEYWDQAQRKFIAIPFAQ